uniref:Ashwin n=1 Tax=Cynoglossus semilaevis TaxID=244447 RepID=A0A3P8V113_CYNSE
MAASRGKEQKDISSSDVDLLLHPELLSQDFLKLVLKEKHVRTAECGGRDGLTELYLRHVIPLPQRTLPNSRWGRRVAKSRGSTANHRTPSDDNSRKRPQIVFDGSSAHSCPLKVKKVEESNTSTRITDRLKPPPVGNQSNPIRRLSESSSSFSSFSSTSEHLNSDTANVKQEAISSVRTAISAVPTIMSLKSPDVKKKIQHVTWP